MKADCAACAQGQPCTATPVAGGRMLDTRGRFPVEQGGAPEAGRTRSFERNYDVQAFTGYPTSTVPAGQWYRGQLVRQSQPVFVLTSLGPMFDPTDARTWPRNP